METINYNTNNNINQEIEIISLQKDSENVQKRVSIIENKQDKYNESLSQTNLFVAEQRKTNEYLGLLLKQNENLIITLQTTYSKEGVETKLLLKEIQQDLKDTKLETNNKLHTLELAMINENNKQNENSSSFKWNSLTKGLTWIIGIILTCIGLFLKFK